MVLEGLRSKHTSSTPVFPIEPPMFVQVNFFIKVSDRKAEMIGVLSQQQPVLVCVQTSGVSFSCHWVKIICLTH